ncbi:MAG: ferritin-like domain-containing protein [Burkholderiales bacterium]|nr:ferritin-like domain-containing protein [Burkholderiales bacterium]
MPASPFLLDVQTLRTRTRRHLEDSAAAPDMDAQRATILNLLNEAFATETLCALRYKHYHHHFSGSDTDAIALSFGERAREEQGHADMIAQRIVELNGAPGFSRDGLISWEQTDEVLSRSFVELVKEVMIVECITIDIYRDIIRYVSDRDRGTNLMIAGILAVEERHAQEMAAQLEALPA